ncbi:LL-diaminopimelate aminotransferase, chloroplastic [Tanacetum coccineum]
MCFAPQSCERNTNEMIQRSKRAGQDLLPYKTHVSRSENILNFKQIHKRVGAHKLRYPDAKMIGLGLGDTAQRIPKVISSSMAKGLQGAQDWAWKKKT